MIKTIAVPTFFAVDLWGEKRLGEPLLYAAAFARAQSAHLTAISATLKVKVLNSIFPEAGAIVRKANQEIEAKAKAFEDSTIAGFAAQGLAGQVETVAGEFDTLCEQVMPHVRAADLIVAQPDTALFSLQQNFLEHLIIESGRPVVLAPTTWTGPFRLDRIVVCWDGSGKSARAVGDALPLLVQAGHVEIVSVEGEARSAKRLDGSEIARHLSRHCKNVSLRLLTSENGDVAKTLGDHAHATNADLLVMGAYAHSRWRQVVLGGTTKTMIHDPVVPTFMSF